MEPKESYASAVLERFCEAPPFSDILIGLAGCLKAAVLQQKTTLPTFTFPQFDYAKDEPNPALELRRTIHVDSSG